MLELSERQAQALEARLLNWADWLAMPMAGGGSGCGSAERMYRAPRDDGSAMLAAVARSSIDVLDGERIELAVTSIPSRGVRVYLAMQYVRKRSERYIARRLKVREDHLSSMHAHALASLQSALNDIERVQLIKRGAPIWAGIAPRR